MRILIIGGGAAGMMAALTASEQKDHHVILVERQSRMGRKLLATGNGRCNLTNRNLELSHYHGEQAAFCRPALEAFGVEDTLFVHITHFYVSPQYVISYVVSNDAALQLYQMELLNPGSGLACYMDNLTTAENQLLSFLAQAGMESPFAEGRINDVKETFQSIFK